MTDRASFGRRGLTLLTLGALALALWTTGGPMSGQRETRDATRLDDLQALASYALCLEQEDGALPDTLRLEPACAPDPRRTDPFTGAAYAYTRLSPESFRLCARFEQPERITTWTSPARRFDAGSGCLIVHRTEG